MRNSQHLDPVQAWLLGQMDTAALRDHCDDPAVAARYGLALADQTFARELIAGARGQDGVA